MSESLPAGVDVPDDPVIGTVRLIGRKWHPVVLHRLLDGPMGFSDLERSVDGIASKTLSNTLKDLEDKGLVDRRVISERPFRVEYSLTDLGASLRPVLAAMESWGTEILEPAEAPEDAVARAP